MELKYGQTKTYKYELDKERLNWLTDRTYRSNGQTQFLFQLVDGDFKKLKQLEMKIKNCFYCSCPADKETVEEVMNMQSKSEYFSL
jgi:hypothetical protein